MTQFGHDAIFFDMLEAQGDAAHKAAEALVALTQDLGQSSARVEAITRTEAEADALTHSLVRRADEKFVTPFDKEDLHALAEALGDVTAAILSVASRLNAYQLPQPRPDLMALTQTLNEQTEAVYQGVCGLRHLKNHKEADAAFVRCHDLQKQIRRSLLEATADLLNNGDTADPLTALKWKDIYDRLEGTTQTCEKVSDLLENMVVKYR